VAFEHRESVPVMACFALLSFTDEEVEIARAEAEALLGPARFEGRLAFCARAGDVTPGAYVNWCARELACAATLDALCERISAQGLGADDFKVIVVKPKCSGAPPSQYVASRIASHLKGQPDLSHPKVQFAIALTGDGVRFGRIVSQADKSWRKHLRRPRHCSTALPVRLARAIVNMAVQPGDSVLDPCCGVGTLLVEAASIGASVFGSDINWRMVAAARENLSHFGFAAQVTVAPAETVNGRFDVIVTDLPYGRSTQADERLYQAILSNLASLAPRAAIVTGAPSSEILQAAGYEIVHVARQFKGTLTRHVYLCRSRLATGEKHKSNAGEPA